MSPDPYVVYVVDDDEAIREWLVEVVTSVGLEARPFADSTTFLAEVEPDRPGCAVVDLRLPLLSGVEVLRRLNERQIPLPVIMMSAYSEIPSVVEAIKRGAVEFLEKPFNGQQILDQIHRALRAGDERRRLLAERSGARARLESLTEKEREVLDAVVQGQPNKITAATLGISEKTVEDRRGRMMLKMKVSSVAELVQLMVSLRE
jgi:two-component system response regulator FixJ